MSEPQMYAVVRSAPDGVEPSEIVVVLAERPQAAAAADELGPGHYVQTVRVVPPGTPWRVAHTYECLAVVVDGRLDRIDQPHRLPGASRLLVADEQPPDDRVHVDDRAAALEAAVHSRAIRYVRAYSTTATQARALAERVARDLPDTP